MDYSGYGWIKVKRHRYDSNKSWEENYKDLEKHHTEEAIFLIDKVRELAAENEALANRCEKSDSECEKSAIDKHDWSLPFETGIGHGGYNVCSKCGKSTYTTNPDSVCNGKQK